MIEQRTVQSELFQVIVDRTRFRLFELCLELRQIVAVEVCRQAVQVLGTSGSATARFATGFQSGRHHGLAVVSNPFGLKQLGRTSLGLCPIRLRAFCPGVTDLSWRRTSLRA